VTRTRSAQLGTLAAALAWAAALACGSDAPTAAGGGGNPLPTDLQVATQCAADGLEDFGEVAKRFLLIEKVHDPNKTLPINLVSYNQLDGSFEYYVDLDDDGTAEARLNGRVRSSSDLSNGLQPGEAFGARWDIRDPVAPFTHHARGAFGNGVLSFSSVHMTLTQFVDTTLISSDTLWAEPTFFADGTCPEFAVTSLQLFVDELHNRGGVIDSLSLFIPRGDIGFTVGDLSAFLLIPEPDRTATVDPRTATGTASFRGTDYDCEVDLATFQATLTER